MASPLRRSSVYSDTSTDDEHDGHQSSARRFWTGSSDGSPSIASSPASSAFSAFSLSSSPGACRSIVTASTSNGTGGRARASTSGSFNALEAFAKLNTLEEHDVDAQVAGIVGHSPLSTEPGAPDSRPALAAAAGMQILYPPAQIENSSVSPFEPLPVQAPAGPPNPSHIAANHVPHDAPAELVEEPTASSSRPPLRTKLSQKLFAKTRERSSSLSKLSFGRPALERRQATTPGQLTPDARPSTSSGLSPSPSQRPVLEKPRQRALKKLQGRFARSEPVSPAFSPSPSTERVHLFRSRPSSIVVSSRGVEFNYFTTAHAHAAQPESQTSSCNASVYQLALEDQPGVLCSPKIDTPFEDAFQDALPRDTFSARLPREVKLKVFKMVVQSCIDDLQASIAQKKWTASRAAQERWVGRAGGLRELVKLSRVCREWRDLAFDGQLWQNVAISNTLGNAGTFSSEGLIRLAWHSGAFLRRLNLRGYSRLSSNDLDSITAACAAPCGVTSLTHIDLIGCVQLSTEALHFLLAHSPALAELHVRGLAAVVSSTCYVVLAGRTDGKLKVLDISLCRNLLAAALLEIGQPGLQRLYAAKVPSMDDAFVAALPDTFTKLEYLDIGYSRQVTDQAFARWPSPSTSTSRNTSEDEPAGMANLEGLRLTGCTRLTDQTCTHLVGKVPLLECLELASIGSNLRDPGLIKLLEACRPTLRKLDLEDASSLSDRVLSALLPAKHARSYAPPSPLEHLVVTNVPDLSEQALVRLVRACPALRVLECAGSNHVSEAFVRSFAHHVKKYRLKEAELGLLDCRNVGRQAFRENSTAFRPRRGVRDYASRHFEYLEPDSRGKGLAECDPSRTVVHCFWTWQAVDDAENAARALRTANLAREAGTPPASRAGYPFSGLRAVRRPSFGMRAPNAGDEDAGNGERRSSSCVIS